MWIDTDYFGGICIDTDYFGGIRRTTDAFPSFFDSAFTLCYEQYLLERLPLLRRKPAQVGAILGSRFGCDAVLDQDRIVVPAVRGAASVLLRQRHDLRVATISVRHRERPLL